MHAISCNQRAKSEFFSGFSILEEFLCPLEPGLSEFFTHATGLVGIFQDVRQEHSHSPVVAAGNVVPKNFSNTYNKFKSLFRHCRRRPGSRHPHFWVRRR
jgi:hypothetical protein